MKKLIVNSLLLIILIGIPLVPNYLYLYYIIAKPSSTISVENKSEKDLEILIGDIAYLKALLSRSTNNDTNNSGEPIAPTTTSSLAQLIYTLPEKIIFFIPQNLNNQCLSYVNTKNIGNIYLKIPSPPPKLFTTFL